MNILNDFISDSGFESVLLFFYSQVKSENEAVAC